MPAPDFITTLLSGGDGTGGLKGLLGNDLFLSYLSGAGSAISQGQPIAPALNEITQNTLGAKHQANLTSAFAKMLRGEVPEGGKMTTDSKGTSFHIPHAKPSTLSPAPENPTPSLTMEQQSNFAPKQIGAMDTSFMSKFLNPSNSQQEIPISAFAGLSSKDVNAAFSNALNIEGMKSKKVSAATDILYKNALIKQAIANAKKAEAGNPLDKQYPIPHYQVGPLTQRQWDALPKEDKEYSSYSYGTIKNGEIPLTKKQYELLKPTDKEKILRAFQEDPKLFDIAKQYANASSTKISIGDKIDTASALGKLKSVQYFDNPKWTDDLSKYMSSEEVQKKLYNATVQDPNVSPEKFAANEKVDWVENKIRAGGGDVEKVYRDKDGKTIVWEVTYPNPKGSKYPKLKKEIKYDVGY